MIRPLLFSSAFCAALGLSAIGCTGSPPSAVSSLVSARPIDSTPPPKNAFAKSLECVHKGPGTDYEVGPGKKYEKIGDVPMESLRAGDTVRIHYRAEPYREKLMISGLGKPDAPIRVCGVKGPNGELPIIDGEKATTRPTLAFPYDGHQVRGLVTVGWNHGDWKVGPEHIVIEGLEVRNASPPYEFTDKAGKTAAYTENAAGIYVQRAKHVIIRGNIVHDNGNGLFVGTGGGEELTEDVLIESNYVYNNGSDKNYYHHNVYNEASGVVYQFNHFGPPKANPTQGILGANIKERSAGVVIRYNWIEDGAHLIDLVDSQEARDPNVKSPTFHESWVYGNVLLRGPTASGSMVHYGGDSEVTDTYRKGTLHFFQNTVVIENSAHKQWEKTAIFELSSNEEHLVSKNNVYMADPPHPERPVFLFGGRDNTVSGVAKLEGDWIRDGITLFEGRKETKVVATVEGLDGCTRGKDPGFVDLDKRDFHLSASCTFTGKGVAMDVPATHKLLKEYVAHGKGTDRAAEPLPTPGAFGPPKP